MSTSGHEDIVAAIQRARAAEYKALKREADRLGSQERSRRGIASRHDRLSRAVRHLRDRFNEIRLIDFFNAPGGAAAADAISALEGRLAAPVAGASEVAVRVTTKEFTNRRWVTRPRPGVDRMASAWLIRRFIDPKARFGFVAQPAGDDVPFDMYAGDFSHQGTLCTFEVLAQRFRIADPTVVRLGHIVHDLDMKEARYGAAETPAVGRMVEGLRQVHPEDPALLEQGMAMFEALARSFDTTEPAKQRRKTKASK